MASPTKKKGGATRQQTRETWPRLVSSILEADGDPALTATALVRAANAATGADGSGLVRWIRGRPRLIDFDGDIDELPDSPPPEGLSADEGRQTAAVRTRKDTYVLANWHDERARADDRQEALEALRALAGVASATIARRPEVSASLAEVAAKLIGSRDLDEVLLEVANSAARLLRAEIAGILLLDSASRMLEMRCSVGHRTMHTPRLRIAAGQGLAGKALLLGEPQKVDDYASSEEISKEFLPFAKEEGTQSAMCAPMRIRGRTAGVVCVWRRRRSVFGDEDVHLLSALASLAAVAVERAILYEAEQETTETLARAHEELEERYRATERALKIHEKLTELAVEGTDVGVAVETVRSLTGGRVALVGHEQTVLADAPAGAGLEVCAAGLLRDAGSRTSVLATQRFDRGDDGWLLVAPVRAAGAGFGNLCVTLPTEPDAGDIVAVEQTATVCALLIAREEAAIEARRRFQSEFIWDLLEGRLPDVAEGLVRARHLGNTLQFPARVMLVVFEGLEDFGKAAKWPPEELERARGRLARNVLADLESRTTGRLVSALRASQFAVIIPVGRARSGEHAHELGDAAVSSPTERGVRLITGVSQLVHGMADLGDAFRQAQFALSASAGGSHSVSVFDDLGVIQFLLAPAQRDDLDRFAEQVLGPLVQYDRAHRTELIRSLDTYLALDCSLQRSAEELYVHHKTMRYRLRRTQEITGLDLKSQEDRFNAQLALKILKLGTTASGRRPATVVARQARSDKGSELPLSDHDVAEPS